MHFKPMDPELVWKALEGQENILDPEVLKLNAFYRQFRCKRCGGACQKENVKGHVFADPDTLVPRACLRCLSCGCLFDPHSGILLETGTPAVHLPDQE